MTTQDRIALGGFVSLAALIVTLGGVMFAQFDWLRDGVNSRIDRLNHRIDGVEERMTRLEEGQRELSERMARFEGTLSAVVAMAGPIPPPDDPGPEARR